MSCNKFPGLLSLLAGWLAIAPADGGAQTAPAVNAPTRDEVVTLSPFEVLADQDTGYVATNTLAGNRFKTSLQDTPAPITIFTKDLIDDLGITDVNQALEYSLNATRDNTDATGNTQRTNDLIFLQRGFSGQATRNFFPWTLSSDTFNTERIEFARGPNAILYGIGTSGGVVNTDTKRARIGTSRNAVSLKAGGWNEYRATVDVNQALIEGKLAARLNLVYHNRDSFREFVNFERKGLAAAMTFRPFPQTELRVEHEQGNVEQVVADNRLAQEKYLAWSNAGRPIVSTWGGTASGTSTLSTQIVYDPISGLLINSTGGRTSSSGATSAWLANNNAAIRDTSILPRNTAVSGPGYRQPFDYHTTGVFLEQMMGQNLAFELAYLTQAQYRTDYRPQVFNDVALRVDVNAQLPNGQPNPNVGKYYTDGTANMNISNRRREDYRATLTYKLDLARRSEWIGSHMFALMATRGEDTNRGDGTFREVNMTPNGSAQFPFDLTNGNNQIRRRTYLDFSSGDPARRGMLDPFQYPIVSKASIASGTNSAPTVTSGWVRGSDGNRNDLTRLDSWVFALQSKLLKNHLVFTGGLRGDRRYQWGSTSDLNGNGTNADDRDPITRVYPMRIRSTTAQFIEGDTKGYGVVVHTIPAVSFTYNNSVAFQPQTGQFMNGSQIGNRVGNNEDFGVRVRLFSDQLNLVATKFKTDEANQTQSRDNGPQNAISAIESTLNFPFSSGSDTIDRASDGYEFELTYNPIKNLSFRATASHATTFVTNIQPGDRAYVESRRVVWTANSGTNLTSPPSGLGLTTIGSALAYVDSTYAVAQQQNGQRPRQNRENDATLTATYRFLRADHWIDGLALSSTVRYRGPWVVGYDSSKNNALLTGANYTLVDLMANYTFKLGKKRNLKLQLNVENLLDKQTLILRDATQLQEFDYQYQPPRRASLTATYSF